MNYIRYLLRKESQTRIVIPAVPVHQDFEKMSALYEQTFGEKLGQTKKSTAWTKVLEEAVRQGNK